MKKLIGLALLCSTAYAQETIHHKWDSTKSIKVFIDSFLPPQKEITRSGIAEATPYFRSYPYVDVQAVIYFNFDGQTVNSPYWNGGVPFLCGESGMTYDKKLKALQRTAEDNFPFKINITTDSMDYHSATKRAWVVVTPTNGWRPGVGGIASVNVLNFPMKESAFVFSNQMQYDDKFTGECMTHEAGHNIGLIHQSYYDANCNKIYEYHPGFGETLPLPGGWAPLEGTAYYREQTTYSNGATNRYCTDIVSEVDTIRSKGIDFRTPSDSLILMGVTNHKPLVVPVLSNVKVKLKSYGNTKTQIQIGSAISSNADTLGSELNVTLLPGVYDLQTRGVSNPNKPDGYGNMGQVKLTVIQTPEVIVPLRTDSQYIRRRREILDYSVWTLYGQKVRVNRGELSKALENLPPGLWIIKFGAYTQLVRKSTVN